MRLSHRQNHSQRLDWHLQRNETHIEHKTIKIHNPTQTCRLSISNQTILILQSITLLPLQLQLDQTNIIVILLCYGPRTSLDQCYGRTQINDPFHSCP